MAVLLAVLTLAGALPAGAAAQSAPFAPLPQPQQQAPPPPAPLPTNPSAGDDGLAVWQQVLILGAAVALIGAIAWLIMRDAHRAAPVDTHPRPSDQPKLSAHERERRRRKERDRAKAARQQRKRNRSR
jgi:hypothetical protein